MELCWTSGGRCTSIKTGLSRSFQCHDLPGWGEYSIKLPKNVPSGAHFVHRFFYEDSMPAVSFLAGCNDLALMLGESVLYSYLGFFYKEYHLAETCIEELIHRAPSHKVYYLASAIPAGCLENQAASMHKGDNLIKP